MTLRAWLALGAMAVLGATPWAATIPPAQGKVAPSTPRTEADGFLPDTTVVARVDRKVIRADEYVRSYFDADPEFRPGGDSTGRVTFMNSLIDMEVMGRVARAANYPLTFEDRLVLRQHTDRVLSNLLFQRFVADTIHVDEAQVRRVFEQYSRDLHLREIMFDDPESAEQTRKDLVAKKITWAQAAKAHHLPPDARDDQGDIDWIDRENFDPMLGLELFDLKPGQISSVVADAVNYHLFYVVAERPGKHMTYEAARRLISDQLRDRSLAAGSRHLKDMVAQGLEMKFDTANVQLAASHFRPARTSQMQQGVPNVEFNPQIPEFKMEDTSRVLVRWRDGRVTIGDFNHHYSEIPTLLRPNVHTPTLLMNQVEGLVLEPYLAKAAIERGLDKDSIVVASIQKRRDQITVERMYADSISSKVHITKAARRKYFDDHSEKYTTWADVRFAAIAVPAKSEADSLAKRLRAGDKAADILLADSLAGVHRGSIQERSESEGGAYQAALFEELRPGQVSIEGPDDQGTYLVLQLLAYHPRRPLSFDEADRYVMEAMTNVEEEKQLKQFLARHRRQFKIESHPEMVMLIRLRHPRLD
jgi:PPIC-type PPIASE domain